MTGQPSVFNVNSQASNVQKASEMLGKTLEDSTLKLTSALAAQQNLVQQSQFALTEINKDSEEALKNYRTAARLPPKLGRILGLFDEDFSLSAQEARLKENAFRAGNIETQQQMAKEQLAITAQQIEAEYKNKKFGLDAATLGLENSLRLNAEGRAQAGFEQSQQLGNIQIKAAQLQLMRAERAEVFDSIRTLDDSQLQQLSTGTDAKAPFAQEELMKRQQTRFAMEIAPMALATENAKARSGFLAQMLPNLMDDEDVGLIEKAYSSGQNFKTQFPGPGGTSIPLELNKMEMESLLTSYRKNRDEKENSLLTQTESLRNFNSNVTAITTQRQSLARVAELVGTSGVGKVAEHQVWLNDNISNMTAMLQTNPRLAQKLAADVAEESKKRVEEIVKSAPSGQQDILRSMLTFGKISPEQAPDAILQFSASDPTLTDRNVNPYTWRVNDEVLKVTSDILMSHLDKANPGFAQKASQNMAEGDLISVFSMLQGQAQASKVDMKDVKAQMSLRLRTHKVVIGQTPDGKPIELSLPQMYGDQYVNYAEQVAFTQFFAPEREAELIGQYPMLRDVFALVRSPVGQMNIQALRESLIQADVALQMTSQDNPLQAKPMISFVDQIYGKTGVMSTPAVKQSVQAVVNRQSAAGKIISDVLMNGNEIQYLESGTSNLWRSLKGPMTDAYKAKVQQSLINKAEQERGLQNQQRDFQQINPFGYPGAMGPDTLPRPYRNR